MALIARGGIPWLITAFALAVGDLGFWLRTGYDALLWASIAFFAVLLFLLWFFRDPERTPAPGIASPADGRVVRVATVEDPELGRCDLLSIFMSPLDVHVNRAPFHGTVRSVTHIPGGHVPAFSKDAERNERVAILYDTPLGPMKTVQIAGTVARRIVPYVGAGTTLRRGDRIGLIRLGSRCDLLIPVGVVSWRVARGDAVRAGTTQAAEVVP